MAGEARSREGTAEEDYSLPDALTISAKPDGVGGWVSGVDCEGRTIWIADAHRDGKRFVVRADEKLTAFVELESVVRASWLNKPLGVPVLN